MNRVIKDETGKRYDRLLVIEKSHYDNEKGVWFWRCQCDCGAIRLAHGSELRRGRVSSCGCKLKELIGAKHSSWKGYKDISGAYWNIVRRGAVKRNMEFNISKEYAWEIFEKQNGKCALSGVPIKLCPSWRKVMEDYDAVTASLDRIDSSKGYVVNNIQWLHKHVNIMKQDFSEEYFIELCRNISNHTPNFCKM